MKYLKTISELNEARAAAAIKLFKMVVDGNASEIEGVKISSAMAQAALDWFTGSVYGRKYEKQLKTAGMGAVAPLIFGDNWGIKKRIPSKLKAEFKELQAQYKREIPESVVTEGKQPHKEIEKAIKGMKGVSMDIKGDSIIVSNKSGDEFIYSMNDADDVAEFITTIEESVVNESDKTATMLLADEIEGAEYHTAFGDGTTVTARSTKKTWDDGAPVLKYIARAPKKSVDMPKGKFEVVIDNKFGWIYWQAKGVWYGMDYDEDYIPFEF